MKKKIFLLSSVVASIVAVATLVLASTNPNPRVSRILCSTGFLPISNYAPFSMNSTISAHPLTFLRPIPSLK